MTDEELKAIEWRALHAFDAEYQADVRTLVAEVRRLKGLIKNAENQGADGRDSDPACPWCRQRERNPDKHDADCTAFTPDGDVR